MVYNQDAYNAFVNECKAAAANRRFTFVSLSKASKACGVPKAQLEVVATALGLRVNRETKSGGNGKYGLTAFNNGK